MAAAASRAAAILLAAEAAGVCVLAAWQIAALVSGDTDAVASSLALIVLTAIGAAAVAVFAVGTWRGVSWGRSGGIVTQLLVLAVALGAVPGPDGRTDVALALSVPAVLTLALLLLAVSRSGSRRAER